MTRILLSRTDRIGDLVLSTPAIATVRKSFPDAHISIVCSPYNRVVVERNTDVDSILDLPRGVAPKRILSGDWDIAIALAPRAGDFEVAGASRAPLRVGYTYTRRFLQRLNARRFVNRLMISEADPDLSERDPQRKVRHEVDQLLDLVTLAGAHQRVEALRLDITDADRSQLHNLPHDAVVLHLGLRWLQHGSTFESTIQLLRDLRRFELPVVVTYAPECQEWAQQIQSCAEVDALLGSLPFHVWAAALEKARIVITVDTGATHVASAVRRPTVVAFEHEYFRLNSQEWSPYRVPSVLVRKPRDEGPDSLANFREAVLEGVARLLHA